MKLIYTTIILIFASSIQLFAQIPQKGKPSIEKEGSSILENIRGGIGYGNYQYRGDLGSSLYEFGNASHFVNLHLKYRVMNILDVGIQSSFGKLDFKNAKINKTSGAETKRSFESNIADLFLIGYFKFNNGILLREDHLFKPYVGLGVGYVSANTTSIITYPRREVRNKVNGNAISFPITFGVDIKVWQGIHVNYSQTASFLTEDKLDGFSRGKGNGLTLNHNLGVMYYFQPKLNKKLDEDYFKSIAPLAEEKKVETNPAKIEEQDETKDKFSGGKLVEIDPTIPNQSANEIKNLPPSPTIRYGVQLYSMKNYNVFKRYVDRDVQKSPYKISKLKCQDKTVKFIAGEFKTYEEARKAKLELIEIFKKEGIFIQTYEGRDFKTSKTICDPY